MYNIFSVPPTVGFNQKLTVMDVRRFFFLTHVMTNAAAEQVFPLAPRRQMHLKRRTDSRIVTWPVANTCITSPRLPRSPGGIFDVIAHIKGAADKERRPAA